MLLFDSLHMASHAMGASQLGMQVVGQNLTNAQTPGYVREQLLLETGTSRKLNNNTITGTGVQVNGVVQVIDKFLEERLRTSTSEAMSSSTREKYYTALEALLNETTDVDLSSSLGEFFNSIDNVLNKPESVTNREMAADQGEKLAEDINRLALMIVDMRYGINTSIDSAADNINQLLKEIEELNASIPMLEAGNNSDALGLRDRRYQALTQLSQLINIKTTEDENGRVSIYCGSDMLLADGMRNEVKVDRKKAEGDDVSQAFLCIRETMSPLDVRSGMVAGLYEAHSEILGGYSKKLDDFTDKLIREFNKTYTSGQGLTGYSELTSLAQLDRPEDPLNQADLDFPVVNGGFYIQRYNSNTETTTEHYIPISVEPEPESDPFSLRPTPATGGTSLADIAASINEIDGLSARITHLGELEITTESSNVEFSFAKDSSGALAALGINTFFTGTTAATIGVNKTVLDDPNKFAASLGGVGQDTENGVKLAAMAVDDSEAFGDRSIIDFYDGIVSETMLAAGTTKSVAASDTLYHQSLQTQRDSISGVNIDEETIQMMTYQRMYQANSRLVTMINDMLYTLINM